MLIYSHVLKHTHWFRKLAKQKGASRTASGAEPGCLKDCFITDWHRAVGGFY